MATNRFNLVTLIFSALLLVPFAITALASASSSSVPAAENAAEHKIMSPPAYPERWGRPPLVQTRDYVQLPGNYGRGSGTLRKWILQKMEEDVANGVGAENEASSSSSSYSATRIAADDRELWPNKNLVGMSGEDAKFAVLAGDETLLESNVQVIPEDSMVTMDYREDRVRIFVDANGIVVSQPTKG
ncbi:hypothetical protein ACHAW5_001004 [Stephanodiscus triporus]|uniref:Uncharacterized protein n=1 Tax=Stephanodiscus triporus TaxID=2934178 RepID=A0ABD3NUD1_9STRA